MSSKYTCPFDAATQKKALEELYEDPKNRQGAIDTFREWIKQQKHMKCPTDDVFLLGFLRAKHFSQLEARQALEKFMEIREKLSSWMKNLDPTDKNTNDVLDTGVAQLLQTRDHDGRKVGIVKQSLIDGGDKKKLLAFCRLFACVGYNRYFIDELTQIHGTVFMADWTGHSMAKEMKTPIDVRKNMITMLTKTFPSRVKGVHLYNAGVMLDFFTTLLRSMLNDKLQKRMHVHNHGLESVYKHIPMEILPEDYLPDDYSGPNAGSQKQVIAALKSEIQRPPVVARIKHLSSEEFYIKIKEKDTSEPAASFRKLNVD